MSTGGGPDIATIVVPIGIVVVILVILVVVGCCCWLSRRQPSEEEIRERQKAQRSASRNSQGRSRSGSAGSGPGNQRGRVKKKKKKSSNLVKSLSSALKFEKSIYYSEGSRTINTQSGARVSFNTRRPRKGSTATSVYSGGAPVGLSADGESLASGASSQPRSILKTRNDSSDLGSELDSTSLASGARFGNGSVIGYGSEAGDGGKHGKRKGYGSGVSNGGGSASVKYIHEGSNGGRAGPPVRGAAINFEPDPSTTRGKKDKVMKHGKHEAYANTMADSAAPGDDESRAYRPSRLAGGDGGARGASAPHPVVRLDDDRENVGYSSNPQDSGRRPGRREERAYSSTGDGTGGNSGNHREGRSEQSTGYGRRDRSRSPNRANSRRSPRASRRRGRESGDRSSVDNTSHASVDTSASSAVHYTSV